MQLHLLVLIFAATTILGRLTSVSTCVLVSWRCAVAAVGAALWCLWVKRKSLGLERVAGLKLLGIGVVIGLHWLCLFGAVKVANVSIALAGLATLSLFTAMTEPLMMGRRPRAGEVFLGLIALAGILLIAGVETRHAIGLGLALMSALLAAIFMVMNRKVVIAGADPMVMVAWEMAAAAAVSAMSIPLVGEESWQALWITNAMDWIWIVLLAVVCTVFAQAWTNHLLRSVSAFSFNLTANFEPVYGMAAAAIIFGENEQVRPAFYGGAMLIALSNVLQPWLQMRCSTEA